MTALQDTLQMTRYMHVLYLAPLQKAENSSTLSATCNGIFYCEVSCKEGVTCANFISNLSRHGSRQRCIVAIKVTKINYFVLEYLKGPVINFKQK